MSTGGSGALGYYVIVGASTLASGGHLSEEDLERALDGGSCPATSSLGAMCAQTGFVWGRRTMEYVVV